MMMCLCVYVGEGENKLKFRIWNFAYTIVRKKKKIKRHFVVQIKNNKNMLRGKGPIATNSTL